MLGSCKGDGGQKVGCELVVAGGDPPKVLEAAERVLDQVRVAVAPAVKGEAFSCG